MPSKLSFFTRLYPLILIALIVVSQFLVLPHTAAVFAVVAGFDAVCMVIATVPTFRLCLLHQTAPALFHKLTEAAAAIMARQSVGHKLVVIYHHVLGAVIIALMFLSAHPVYAGIAVAYHFAVALCRRLIAKAHPEAIVALLEHKKD